MFAVITGLALMAAATAEAVPSTKPVVQSQAWIEADGNRPQMKAAPSFVEGPRAELPESEKALGHHGLVVIQGIIGIDGKMSEARVKLTSGAPVLDQIALTAANASTFTPAKDANGTSLPVVISMPFDLVAYKAPGGMGILQYKCEQFVRDMDWWKSVNPDKSFEEHELYKMEIGFEMLSLTSSTMSSAASAPLSIPGSTSRSTHASNDPNHCTNGDDVGIRVGCHACMA